jgi:hypothetical protein
MAAAKPLTSFADILEALDKRYQGAGRPAMTGFSFPEAVEPVMLQHQGLPDFHGPYRLGLNRG